MPTALINSHQSSTNELLLVGWMVWEPMCMQSRCSRDVAELPKEKRTQRRKVIIVKAAARYLSISPCSSISSATSSHLQRCEEAHHHHTFQQLRPQLFPSLRHVGRES